MDESSDEMIGRAVAASLVAIWVIVLLAWVFKL